jgi:hypothetical protein
MSGKVLNGQHELEVQQREQSVGLVPVATKDQGEVGCRQSSSMQHSVHHATLLEGKEEGTRPIPLDSHLILGHAIVQVPVPARLTVMTPPPLTNVTKELPSCSSAASMTVVRGMTLNSNLGCCCEAPSGADGDGGGSDGEGRVWCDGDPSCVELTAWLRGWRSQKILTSMPHHPQAQRVVGPACLPAWLGRCHLLSG